MKLIEKYYKIIVCFLIVFACGFLYLFSEGAGKKAEGDISDSDVFFSDGEDTASPLPTSRKVEAVYIHICGEVKKPGVYQFDHEPRLIEVIKKAGGLTKKAVSESINQAQVVTDGMQIVIESKKQMNQAKKEKSESQTSPEDKDFLINLNTAAKEELMTIPGIGEAKALSIIQYREENGSFKTIEDIMKISGIKEGVYNKIKGRITV